LLASRLRARPARRSFRSCVPSTSAGGRSSRHRASRPTISKFTAQGAPTRTDIVIVKGESDEHYYKLSRPHLLRRVEPRESSTALRGGQPGLSPFGRTTAR